MSDIEVTFRARNAELRTGLATARADVRKFASDAKSAVESTGSGFRGFFSELAGGFSRLLAPLAGLGAILAVKQLVTSAVDYASSVNDAVESTRTNATTLQVLRAAALDAGISYEKLDRALISSTSTTQDAIAGNKAHQQSFIDLKLDAEAFLALPTEQRLAALGSAYLASGKSAQAFNAISDILGTKVGPRLLAVLEDLAVSGYDSLRVSAERAGQVLGEEDVARLDTVGDKFTRLGTRIKVATAEFVAFLDRFANSGSLGGSLEGDRAVAAIQREAAARREAVRQFGAEAGAGMSDSLRAKFLAGLESDLDRIAADLADRGRTAVSRGTSFVRRPDIKIYLTGGREEFEARVQQILAQQTEERIKQGRLDEEELANRVKIDAQRERAASAQRVATALAEVDEKLAFEKLGTLAQIVELEKRQAELLDRITDPSVSEARRLDAVKQIELVERAIAALQKQAAKDEASSLDARLAKLDQEADARARTTEQQLAALKAEEEKLIEQRGTVREVDKPAVQKRLEQITTERTTLEKKIPDIERFRGNAERAGRTEDALALDEARVTTQEKINALVREEGLLRARLGEQDPDKRRAIEDKIVENQRQQQLAAERLKSDQARVAEQQAALEERLFQRRLASLAPEQQRLALAQRLADQQRTLAELQQSSDAETIKGQEAILKAKGAILDTADQISRVDDREQKAEDRAAKEADRNRLTASPPSTDSLTSIGGGFNRVSRGSPRQRSSLSGENARDASVPFGVNAEGGRLGFRPEFGRIGAQRPGAAVTTTIPQQAPINVEAAKQTSLQQQMAATLKAIENKIGNNGGAAPVPVARFRN